MVSFSSLYNTSLRPLIKKKVGTLYKTINRQHILTMILSICIMSFIGLYLFTTFLYSSISTESTVKVTYTDLAYDIYRFNRHVFKWMSDSNNHNHPYVVYRYTFQYDTCIWANDILEIMYEVERRIQESGLSDDVFIHMMTINDRTSRLVSVR